MKSFLNALLVIVVANAVASPSFGFQSDDPDVIASRLPATVVLTDGSSAEGTIDSFSETDIKFSVEGNSAEPMTLAFKQIASLNFGSSNHGEVSTDSQIKPQGQVSFTDGSQAIAASIRIENGNATVKTEVGAIIKANVSTLKMISFIDSEADIELKQQLTELLSDGDALPTSDAIIVSKNSRLQLIEGIVGDISDQHITFSIETRTAEVALEKIKGILFYRAVRELTEPLCLLTLVDGSKFQIRSVELSGSNLNLTSIGDLQFTIDANQLARLNFSAGRSVYLSDLVPATNTWTPMLASSKILEPLKSLRIAKFNTDFRGQPLTITSKPESGLSYLVETVAFEKGIAISGGGRVVFALNKQFKRLSGRVGFDPQSNSSSVVRFVVKTDGETAISETMRADETYQPIALDLDVSATNRISFSVEYEDGRLAGDVLHLVDFKVSR